MLQVRPLASVVSLQWYIYSSWCTPMVGLGIRSEACAIARICVSLQLKRVQPVPASSPESWRSWAWGQGRYAYLPKLFQSPAKSTIRKIFLCLNINCLIYIQFLNRLLCSFCLPRQVFCRVLEEGIADNVWNWEILSPRTLSMLLMTVIFFMFLLTWVGRRGWFSCSILQTIIISIKMLDGEKTHFL